MSLLKLLNVISILYIPLPTLAGGPTTRRRSRWSSCTCGKSRHGGLAFQVFGLVCANRERERARDTHTHLSMKRSYQSFQGRLALNLFWGPHSYAAGRWSYNKEKESMVSLWRLKARRQGIPSVWGGPCIGNDDMSSYVIFWNFCVLCM